MNTKESKNLKIVITPLQKRSFREKKKVRSETHNLCIIQNATVLFMAITKSNESKLPELPMSIIEGQENWRESKSTGWKEGKRARFCYSGMNTGINIKLSCT